MTVFADSSALVKRYADEPGAGVVRALPVLVVSAPVDAARLVAAHALRAYDAVQLASARAARQVDAQVDGFGCFDAGLRRAAAAEGCALVG